MQRGDGVETTVAGYRPCVIATAAVAGWCEQDQGIGGVLLPEGVGFCGGLEEGRR